jgi:hypothetical protein
MTTKTKPQEPVLTEFFVTETYIVKAKTIDHAWAMVDSNDFDYQSMDKYNLDIQPNF